MQQSCQNTNYDKGTDLTVNASAPRMGPPFNPQGPIRILKRPVGKPDKEVQSSIAQVSPAQPVVPEATGIGNLKSVKSWDERNAEYTQARLRILGPDYPSSEALEQNPDYFEKLDGVDNKAPPQDTTFFIGTKSDSQCSAVSPSDEPS